MKRRKIPPRCPECGSTMERFNPRNIDHVLATAPERLWQLVLHSPDLMVLACVALQEQDALALAATIQLAGLRLQARRAA